MLQRSSVLLRQSPKMSFVFPWQGKTGRSEGTPGKATSKNEKIPALFQPLKLRGVELKNRVALSPLCQYSSTDGNWTDYHLAHLGSFARGGVALVITEATAVVPEGRITPYCTGLWNDEQADQLTRIVDYLHAFGALACVQLAHAGRKASTAPPFFALGRQTLTADEGGWPDKVVGPSPVAFTGLNTPKQLTVDEIQGLVESYVAATRRADKAGFDVIEIHGAHGYLISSFNSPLANQRTDQYGGSFENRTRFAVEVAKAVRDAFPAHKPVIYRTTSSDWAEGGWTSAENVKLAALLKGVGIDLVDCSSGGVVASQKITAAPGFQVQFAEDVKRGVESLAAGAVGLITTPQQANEIVESSKADIVLLGRELLRDPQFVLTAARALKVDVEYSLQHDWCIHPPFPPRL
eukprot:TRINITY_DN11154_c0_g1_i1.p1 TRINITY_DN11154_c0_g1~~TRINITY_DN11154_c0_g1_i1.p1  ORF type:complete len:426 (-),score=87.13 TRINITY_DN11154_c0_g1_i1:214-1434(-)